MSTKADITAEVEGEDQCAGSEKGALWKSDSKVCHKSIADSGTGTADACAEAGKRDCDPGDHVQ